MPQETITIRLTSPSGDVGRYNHDNSGYSDDFLSAYLGFCGFEKNVSLSYQNFGAWLRFQLPFSSDDTIDEAKLRLVISPNPIKQPSTATWVVKMRLKAHDVDNSANPANHSEALSFWDTTAYVDFDIPQGGQGYEVYVMDLKDVITEIITRGGWSPDNYICLLWRTNQTAPQVAASNRQVVRFFDDRQYNEGTAPSWLQTSENYPKLIVKYTPGVPAGSGYTKSVVHDVVIIQEMEGVNGTEPVQHILGIEQDIVYVLVHNKAVEHELEIEQEIHVSGTIEAGTTHVLPIIQDISQNRDISKAVEHILTIQQENTYNLRLLKKVKHEIFIEQDIDYGFAYSRELESSLSIEQTIDQNINNRTLVHTLRIEQTIGLEANLQNPENVETVLVIEQDIAWGANRTRGIEHELVLQQSVLGYLETSECRVDIDYSPFADENVLFPDEPTLTPSSFVLQYPTTSPTLSITLPKPLFGNREELTLTRIQRKTRGGELVTYTDMDWGFEHIMRYKFEGLTTTKIEELYTFIANTLGLRIRLFDHEGRHWDGYIVNTAAESGQYLRICGLTTEFDFNAYKI